MKHVVVLGAAGKMGRGIALLLLQHLVVKGSRLTLVDPDVEALYELRPFFETSLRRFAEKRINHLRPLYQERRDLVDNSAIIDAFIKERLDALRFQKEPSGLSEVDLVFEAAPEMIDLKIALLHSVKETGAPVLTNTSSIPIHYLAEEAGLSGRLVGFHFYNPAHLQPLVELIFDREALKAEAYDLVEKLEKRPVVSKDIAGFIGNGHFLREVSYAVQVTNALGVNQENLSFVDRVTRDYLLRPMGIFELVNFVGVDVVLKIAGVMEHFLEMDLQLASLKEFKEIPLTKEESGLELSWKALRKDKKKEDKVEAYEKWLTDAEGKEASFARDYLSESRRISLQLVETGVAASIEDVHTVLKLGFQQVLV